MAGVGYGSTAVDWGNFCGDLFIEYYVRNITYEKLKGKVEIDESLFGRRTKYHRGDPRWLKVWIVGLVERDTNRLKLFPGDSREADTLIPIIRDNVQLGARITTDWCAAYNPLARCGYTHYVGETTFSCQCRNVTTNEIITVHTNRIEGAWKHAKEYFRRMNRTKITQFEYHLCELMWRWWAVDHEPLEY